jgi:hypothetical protein
MRFPRVLLALLAASPFIALAACSDTPEPQPDASFDADVVDAWVDGGSSDSSTDAPPDALVSLDMGDDAALPEVDAGDDAGLPEVDAGLPEIDAGLPEVDAGLPEIDAGLPEIDAGLPEIDAGLPEVDAGQDASVADAGCSSAAVCDDGNACTVDACDVGACTHAAINLDDGNACTTDTCAPVGGIAHTPISITDNDVCTTDACDPVTGISHTALPVTDNDVCTTDACDPVTGITHTAIPTTDNDVCTTDACDPVTGVSHTALPVTDNDVCTTDACDPVTGITHTAISLTDNDVCTADACDPITGVSHTAISITDNDVCTTDACDPVLGVTHTPISITDNNVCTIETCDPIIGVMQTLVPITDNDVCTADACDRITGVSHTAISITDGDACTADTCDPVTGVAHTAIPVTDNDVCTTDACDPVTGLTHTPISITDNDVCTADACDPVTGVSHTAVPVTDNDVCTTDACDPIAGVSHTAIPITDGDACTTDTCDPVTGVAHAAVNADDGNACTVDSCDPTTGVAHMPLSVDDSDVCTLDACDPAIGAVHVAVSIDDLNPCTVDSCDPVTGVAHTAVNVDDGLECTADSCNSATGAVVHAPLGAGAGCTQGGGVVCDGAGACVALPAVASTTPGDATSTSATTPLAVTFTAAMDPTRLTAQTTAGACSGSVQISLDNFATCIALSSSAPTMSSDNTTATFTAAPGLLVNRTYKLRVTTSAWSAAGLPLGATFTMPTGFTTGSPDLCAGSVVIAQAYGGGGNTGAPYKNDFVVLHNRGTTAASLAGWSLQYASAANPFTATNVAALSGTIAPGGYFLIQGGGGTIGAALTGVDLVTTINMSATVGKIALVSNATVLAATCPPASQIVDFVGFGATASCSEGSGPTPAPSNTTAVIRAQAGCGDVNNNAIDFVVGAPVPWNSATPAAVCSCSALDESGSAAEVDYCSLLLPASLTLAAGASSGSVTGQLYDLGVTEAAGAPLASANVRAQLGFGPATANPEYESTWSWTNAAWSSQTGNNDVYQASFNAPATTGSYRYAYRFSLDSGVSWTVCDNYEGDMGSGSNSGLTFDLENLAVMTVN